MRRWQGVVATAVAAFIIPVMVQAQAASSYDSKEEAKPTSGYDGGFFLRSADDEFSLQAYTRVQFQHLYSDIRQSGAIDTNTFRLRRGRIIMLGKIFKNFEFTAVVGAGTSPRLTTAVTGCAGCTVPNPNPMFWVFDATATIIPQFKIQVGNMSTPLDWQGELSTGNMAFVEQPITATQEDGDQNKTIARQAFGTELSTGVRLLGDISKFHYILGVTNGEAWNFFNQTREFAYGARVWYDILGEGIGSESDVGYSETPSLSVGAGFAYEPQNATDSIGRTLDWAWNASGDAELRWRGFSFTGEAYLRKIRVNPGNFTLDDFGYYAQAGYFVIPKKLEIVARGAQIFREGPDNNAYEFAGGLNWFIHGKNVKLQTDFSRLVDYDDTVGTGGLATNRFRTQLTFQM